MIRTGYSPELYLSLVLNNNQENYYQNLIGVLSWDVGLKCIDIHVEIALISRYLNQQKKGKIDQLLDIFSYHKRYYCSKVVFDSNTFSWN